MGFYTIPSDVRSLSCIIVYTKDNHYAGVYYDLILNGHLQTTPSCGVEVNK